eukprot:TRINITY_DN11454_c0_g1_i3.p1 TRINITY_DN11454_c0_g1~~TRINITY_DN11454_c0_g1_i3.p1  ORF type:complete len:304 (+),score=7.77 TRINITY_DN11454_c0_g1_i3:290-1201(+)
MGDKDSMSNFDGIVKFVSSLGFVLGFNTEIFEYEQKADFKKYMEAQNASPKPVKQPTEQQGDYEIRLKEWFQAFIQKLGLSEKGRYNKRENENFRVNVKNSFSIFNNCHYFAGPSNYDVNMTGGAFPTVVRETQRTRVYDGSPVSALCYIGAQTITRSEEARDTMTLIHQEESEIPDIVVQQLKVNREVSTGNQVITPKWTPVFTRSELAILGLKRTVFDSDWLCSSEGVRTFFSTCSQLCLLDGCYLKSGKFDLVKWFTVNFLSLTGMTIPNIATYNVQVPYFVRVPRGQQGPSGYAYYTAP